MAKKKTKDSTTYTLTVKGLIYSILLDDQLTNELMDKLELYLRRHYSEDGHPAIIFDGSGFIFATLCEQPIKNKK
jgi:hypothetical protein